MAEGRLTEAVFFCTPERGKGVSPAGRSFYHGDQQGFQTAIESAGKAGRAVFFILRVFIFRASASLMREDIHQDQIREEHSKCEVGDIRIAVLNKSGKWYFQFGAYSRGFQ